MLEALDMLLRVEANKYVLLVVSFEQTCIASEDLNDEHVNEKCGEAEIHSFPAEAKLAPWWWEHLRGFCAASSGSSWWSQVYVSLYADVLHMWYLSVNAFCLLLVVSTEMLRHLHLSWVAHTWSMSCWRHRRNTNRRQCDRRCQQGSFK